MIQVSLFISYASNVVLLKYNVNYQRRALLDGWLVYAQHEHELIKLSSKGYSLLVKTKAVQLGLTHKWLKAQGLVSLKEQWVKFRYPNG